MKKILKLSLVLAMIFGLVNVHTNHVYATGQDDIRLIKERLKDYFLELDTIDDGAKVETCYVSQADEYLAMLNEDGGFPDVNYQVTTGAANGKAWDPYLALDRMQAIAIAYHKEGNSLYHSEAAKAGIEKMLEHWVKQGSRNGKPAGPYSTNWWENEVGVQLRFSRIGLFMEGVIDNQYFQTILDKLIEKTPVKYGSGQNNLWFDQNHVYWALLTGNESKLTDMIDNYLNYCLDTQLDNITKEAVQVDNSFYMHGRQFYSNGYGMSMFRDMSFWIYMLRGTQFSIGEAVIDRMANYMLGGTSWTIRGDLMELYLGYRPYKFDVGYKNYAAEYIEPLKRMIASDTANASRYQAVLNSIENDTNNGKDGNYYMWRSTYAAHMKDGYGVNIKMDSKDVIGGEWRGSWTGEDKGQLIYWTSSAVSTVTVDGDEYTKVYPVFDWAHCPGSTTAARIVKDYSNYGRFTNGTNHTIGVTNGKYGNTAYYMNKKGTQAKKGYFFFDDEFVALGTGISSTESVDIHTTLNQNTAENPSVDGVKVAAGTVNKEYTARSLYNGKVGYVFLDDTNVVVSNDGQKNAASLWGQQQIDEAPNVFKAYINHGTKPSNASYAYIVVPNKTEAQVNEYKNNIPVTVVANNADIQAVRHDGLKQTQINFYKAGSLEYKTGYTIKVDQPCSVMIDESGDVRKITTAVSDADATKTVNVELSYGSTNTKTTFIAKDAPYAGQSITLAEGEDTRYQASSYTTNHGPKNAIDKNLETYWESQTNNEEWVSLYNGSNKYVKSINITWGNNYAREYDIYVSQNGSQYELANTVTDGKGSEETVAINKICSYVKIVAKSGNGSNYQVKEVVFNEGQLLSLNKPVETSSVSTNASTFVGSLAVDGDLGTRWASLRGVDDNWITIDLEKTALIDAMEIYWESACSDNYQIEVSDDNENWTTVKASLRTDDSLTDRIVFDETVSARYVKLHSLKSRVLDKHYGINIYEIKIYGNYVKEPLQNIAKSKPVEMSSVSKEAPTFIGALAVDGDLKTRWASLRNSNDEWITVDLGVLSEIENMNIYWEGACSDNYQIEVSDDNENWTTVKSSLKTDSSLKDRITFNEPIQTRYVKVHSLKSRSLKYGVSIYELEIFGRYLEEPPVNIALNKSSQASSAFVDTKDGNKEYDSSLAFDGRTDKVDGKQSRWVSARETKNEWIYVDLDDFYSIEKVVLNWEGAGAKEYKVQISDDAENWTDLTHVTDGKGGMTRFEYDGSQSGRYVRMFGVEPNSKYGFSLWEFEVYGEKEEPENLALNKPSQASSEFLDTKDGNKKYYSSLAFDGNTDKVDGKQSRWVSLRRKENSPEYSDHQWIYVDLQDYYSVQKVVLNWEGAGAKQYKIQISDDAKNWTDLTHVTDGKGGIVKLEYDGSKSGRYVRMEGIEPGGQYGYSLWEFEVYGRKIPVNKDRLQELYDQFIQVNKDDYTPNSYTLLKEALDNAKDLLDDKKATMIAVKQAEDDLQKAFDQLLRRADKTALKEVIDEANRIIDEEQYTPNSIDVLKKVLKDTIMPIYNNANATDEDVANAQQALQDVMTTLVEKADKTELEQAIKNVDLLDKSIYTPKSLEDFEKEAKLEEAREILADDNATEKEVENAVDKILDAYARLVLKADKTRLEATLKNAEELKRELYTLNSLKALDKALAEAKDVMKDDNATLSDVEEAELAIQNAMKDLKLVDNQTLKDLIADVKAINKELYTKDSIQKLEKVLKEAEKAVVSSDQDKIDKMYKELKKAKDGLVVKKTDVPVEINPINPDKKPEGNKPGLDDIDSDVLGDMIDTPNDTVDVPKRVDTSDSIVLIPYVILGLSALGLYITIIRRRRHS